MADGCHPSKTTMVDLTCHLLCTIVEFCSAKVCRALCHECRELHDEATQALIFAQDTPADAVYKRVLKCLSLQRIKLCSVSTTDDALVDWLLQRPGLKLLDVSLCTKLLPITLPRLRRFAASGGMWVAHGCWRLWEPSPELTPREVVTLQILALRDNSNDGINACFGFASPSNREATGPAERFGAMIRQGYDIMLRSQGAQLCEICCNPDRAAFMVNFQLPTCQQEALFIWGLSKQEGDYVGCWMTDGVMPWNSLQVPGGIVLDRKSFVEV